jgi:hypothetical protein
MRLAPPDARGHVFPRTYQESTSTSVDFGVRARNLDPGAGTAL